MMGDEIQSEKEPLKPKTKKIKNRCALDFALNLLIKLWIIFSFLFKFYVLSNFPGDQFDKYMKQNRYLEEFDDMIISGKVGLKKPDIKIYQLALKKFDCIPSQTLFIDDRPENTDSAKELGLNVITLDNPNKLKEYIKKFI